MKVHTARIFSVEFLNNSVVSGSKDGMVIVCNAQSGEVLRSLTIAPGHDIQCIEFSLNGDLIATGSEFDSSSEVNLWDAQTGTRVLGPLTDIQGSISSVWFSPDGTRILAGSWRQDNQIVVWDVSDGTNLFGPLNSYTRNVILASYSPNGALIAMGSNDGTIIVWDAYTRSKVLGTLVGHSKAVFSVHFSPDSTRLVSGSSDKTICIWDVKTGQLLSKLLPGHEQPIRYVAYSLDGTRIISLSNDRSVRIHDARSTEERVISRSTTEFGDWVINKGGWVVDDQSRLLAWIPWDLQRALMRPRTQVAVTPWGYVRVKFDRSRMGESWAQYYTL